MKRNPVYVLGISCYFHDAAACLLRDGLVIAAAAEERFSRKKHDNDFPTLAIEYCLKEAGIAANELTTVVFYEKPIVKFERVLSQHLEFFPKSFKSFVTTAHTWINLKLRIKEILKEKINYHGTVHYIDHHLAHAASAHYFSGFRKSVIVTLDGVGEWSTTTSGSAHDTVINLDSEIRFPHSLGLLYSAITSYLGFSVNDAEYKVMGLAAYGDPKPYTPYFDKLIKTFPDGSFTLDLKYFDFGWSDRMYNEKLIELFGLPAREPEAAMIGEYENIAAALQRKLETVVIHLLKQAHKKYQIDNLCLAGGVALNSVLNGKILSQTPFKQLFIPPDPSDAGGALGAAAYFYFNSVLPKQIGLKTGEKPSAEQQKITNKQLQTTAASFTPYLGPSFAWYSIEKTLKEKKLPYKLITNRTTFLKVVSSLLADEKILGWFQGKMEWGPRALGSRSILASAARTEMRDIINEKVKHRELFRPFAPVVLEEYTDTYFIADKNLPTSARYMLMVYPFKKIGFKAVPAVVHVDKTGRLQTLKRADNPLYYDLISQYHKKTGTPIIINTSFNIRGEPIVCTPAEAINCFLHTDIDYLIMDQYIVSKPKKKRI